MTDVPIFSIFYSGMSLLFQTTPDLLSLQVISLLYTKMSFMKSQRPELACPSYSNLALRLAIGGLLYI
jgi:hypothetical protein